MIEWRINKQTKQWNLILTYASPAIVTNDVVRIQIVG